MFYHLTPVSSNKKVGPIPVSTTSAVTCPTSCPLNNHNGCYADTGPLALHWKRVTAGLRGMSFDDFTEAIAALPAGQVWRYAQAGDLPGEGDDIDVDQLAKLVKANAGRPVIAYTHKPLTGDNLKALKEAKKNGFHVNLSADSMEEVDEFVDVDMPVVVTLPEEYGRKTARNGDWSETSAEFRARLSNLVTRTPKGREIAICPATFTDTDCSRCRVCATKTRNEIVIGFPAHGSRKAKITNAARLANTRAVRPENNDAVVSGVG